MNYILNANQIREILPHRYPFLFLDGITEIDPGYKAVGIKNVTINEPFFQGHFSNKSIMPGVLIIEALAQLTAVMYCTALINNLDFQNLAKENLPEKVGYLVGIKNFRFKSLVTPGDQLRLETELIDTFGNISTVKVGAYVNSICKAKGLLTVSQSI